eukprot:6548344-Pyramimonas_sp.AAC.1
MAAEVTFRAEPYVRRAGDEVALRADEWRQLDDRQLDQWLHEEGEERPEGHYLLVLGAESGPIGRCVWMLRE